MPITELDVELQKRADAQKEFDDAVNDIMDKTDEEIREIEEARVKDSDGAGELTRDQNTSSEPVVDPNVDPLKKPDTTPDPTLSAANDVSEVAALKSEVESLKSELQKERQRTSSWDGRIKAANDKVKSLEVENTKLTEQLSTKAVKEENEQDDTDQEVMDKFRKTFPELVDVVDILEKRVAANAPAKAKSVDEPEVKTDTAKPGHPAAEEEDPASTEHYDATRKAHPDMDEAVNSGVLLTWINRQTGNDRSHLENVYYGKDGNGTTQQVIDMVTEFKKKSGWKSALAVAPSATDLKLQGMIESEGSSTGAKTDGPDKNDFDGAAKEAFK